MSTVDARRCLTLDDVLSECNTWMIKHGRFDNVDAVVIGSKLWYDIKRNPNLYTPGVKMKLFGMDHWGYSRLNNLVMALEK